MYPYLTRKQYRIAIKNLEKDNLITIKPDVKASIVQLNQQRIFSIKSVNDRNNRPFVKLNNNYFTEFFINNLPLEFLTITNVAINTVREKTNNLIKGQALLNNIRFLYLIKDLGIKKNDFDNIKSNLINNNLIKVDSFYNEVDYINKCFK